MTTLHTYLREIQRLGRDQKQEFNNPDDLISYINTARREIAMRSQAIRRLTPIAAQVISARVTSGGSGYVNPTVVISPPDFPSGYGVSPGGRQATALATLNGGVISGIDIVDGGSGYFSPTVTITDSAGSGATATLALGPMNTLNQSQEVYNFSDIDLSQSPGCSAVYYVRSIAVIYADYRYVLPSYAFSEYQARVRQFPFQFQYVPTFCSFFGQGTNGSVYCYPLPSQTYQMEWDCLCLPTDLTDNLSVEALPQPWTDTVKFYAMHLVMLERGNYNAAKMYLDLYEKFALSYSAYARIGRTSNPYGRY